MCTKPFSQTKNKGKLFLVAKSSGPLLARMPLNSENLRICQYCSSHEIENEIHFLLYCNHYENIRKQLTNDIKVKYAGFESLNLGEQDKIIFLFNNVDTYVCKRLDYFVYEALQIRNEYTNGQIHNKFQPIVL